ncbi:MAG: ABC transporter ATP-binding protein [Simkaniaceae bacterium]|nr:ABC transporter ATP-binding protein [Simkaniaceae bacterium]
MPGVRLKGVTKLRRGEFILDRIDLTVPAGEFFVLLGPSGCGKTTLLRLIAGFEPPDSGAIYLGDTDITHLPVHKRNINIVFQNYALFPHLNVFDNVAYGPSVKKMAKGLIEEKVMTLLHAFHLDSQVRKYPHRLSGGQQQRVALARAIINEPDVLLLDEPLAALDFALREKMLVELIDLQDKLRTTFIYVTHDRFEALTVADHMAIMNHGGHIEQIGTPKEIYEFPRSGFVAKFVGTTNLFEGILQSEGGDMHVVVEGLGKMALCATQKRGWTSSRRRVFVGMRPEKIFVSKKKPSSPSDCLRGTVEQIVYYGRSTQYNVIVNGTHKIAVFEQNEKHFPEEVIDYDDHVYLYWEKESVLLLER